MFHSSNSRMQRPESSPMRSLNKNPLDFEVNGYSIGVIQAKSSNSIEMVAESADKLSIKAQTQLKRIDPSNVMDSGFNFASELGASLASVLRLTISFSGVEATNISVILKNPEAIRLKESHFNIERLKGSGTPAVIETDFMLDNRIPLTELSIEVTATYDFMGGSNLQTGNIYKSVPISLPAYCYLISPVKDADFKLTLEASSEIPALSTVFKNFIEETSPSREYYENPNVLSFLLNDGSISTVIVAKSSSSLHYYSGKLRIQGSNFDTLFIIMNELENRMRLITPSFRLTYSDALPLKDLFDVVEERRNIAASYTKVSDDIQQQTNQLLFIQKRLLSRYKEKNSLAMNNLDLLLEAAVADLIATTKELEDLQLLYKKNSQRLAISFKMLLALVAMRFPISPDGLALLNKYLPTYVEPSVQEIGWIEIIDINIFYLLKNVLAGSNEQSATAYTKIDDLEVFKKHFTLLIDKISKGILTNYKAPKEE